MGADMKTSEERVTEQLKNLILDGEVERGPFLSQRRLAARLDTSLITVRAALRRLENERLIENVPRWGVRIPTETLAGVQDRYVLREILESAAVERFVAAPSPERARRLLEMARHCDHPPASASPPPADSAAPTDPPPRLSRHGRFHLYLAACSGSNELVETLERLLRRGRLLLNTAIGPHTEGADLPNASHGALARAILSGDEARARETLREHLRQAMERELNALDAAEEAGGRREETRGRAPVTEVRPEEVAASESEGGR